MNSMQQQVGIQGTYFSAISHYFRFSYFSLLRLLLNSQFSPIVFSANNFGLLVAATSWSGTSVRFGFSNTNE